MTWQQAEALIRTKILPGGRGVLKCDGVERRPVTSHSNSTIGMRTGVTTKQTKAITYQMLRHAFDTLDKQGHFDSADFRSKFDNQYRAAPCRYSMTGGVLVEIGVAKLVQSDGPNGCYYVKRAEK